MSSIYRKGRDGYFYYQTYVYNSKTKKKDRRIFHALKTKNLSEAQRKKNDLDAKYKNMANSTNKIPKIFSYIESKKKVTIFILGLVLVVFAVNQGFLGNSKKKSKKTEFATNNVENHIDKIKIKNLPIPVEKISIKEKNSESPKPKGLGAKLQIPDYDIIRIEKLSDSFEQGKLYVTVNKNTSLESQKLLCSKLANMYNEFSNIIIS